jgi:EAL domain
MGMADEADDAVIVRSTVDLGRNLGLDVVADGVETAELWRSLRELGCHTGQGYFISRPVPAGELTAWLAGGATTSWRPDRRTSQFDSCSARVNTHSSPAATVHEVGRRVALTRILDGERIGLCAPTLRPSLSLKSHGWKPRLMARRLRRRWRWPTIGRRLQMTVHARR